MAWPKLKRSRSSQPPGQEPANNGVNATIAPAQDAEPAQPAANGLSNTMLDGFVAGATVTPAEAAELANEGIDGLFRVAEPGPAASADTTRPAREEATVAGTLVDTPVIGATAQPLGDAPQAPTGQRLQDFALDSRMRVWRRRILITVIAGGVFSIIFNWRIGLTIAVLAAIADTIYRSRTIASMPAGVKVSPAMRRTQRQLGRMERAGYRALHNRPIPNSPEFIDHLVVGPTGVYAIDSEKWDRRLPIRTRNARQLWHGPESKKDRLEHAKWEAEQASTLLSGNLGHDITVRPAMAVYGPKVPWDTLTIRDVDVFSGNRLRKYLRRRRKVVTVSLSAQEIEKFSQAAEVVLPL